MRVINRVLRPMLCAVGCALLASCGGGNDDSASATNTANQALDNASSSVNTTGDDITGREALYDRFANYDDDVVLTKDGQISGNSKRSSFEGAQLTSIGGDLGNKKFEAQKYSKKNWNGSKEFDRKAFLSRKNRWNDEEWFLKKQAQEVGSRSRVEGQSFATNNYATASAVEQGSRRLDSKSNVQTEVRQELFQNPEVFSRADYESLSLSESKRRLGRE